jgi:exosortase C (VPDSG-CTERM-specific)
MSMPCTQEPRPTAGVSRGKAIPLGLVVSLAALVCAFIEPLSTLFRFAINSDLYSHVLLIPGVSIYFVWIKRHDLPAESKPLRWLAILALCCGTGILVASRYATSGTPGLPVEDRISGPILAFVFMVTGACAWWLGRRTLAALAFPLGFLLFMVPFPTAIRDGIESFYQHTSAAAASAFFTLAGTTFYREGTFFQLPGINLQVAPECSGIRSSLALFLTSIVAGQLFLRSRVKQLVLALAVIPLGILRNGLRVFTIGELCVHIGPEMIDSPIHHRGGPLFFALSLIPFGILLFALIKSDRTRVHSSRPVVRPETVS